MATALTSLLVGLLAYQGPNYPQRVNSSKPVLMVFQPNSGKYAVDVAFQRLVPKLIWHRRGAIEDFDGDGRNDIFVAGHGADGPTIRKCGDRNVLILNKPTGYVFAERAIPSVSDYSHGLIVDDFDGDQKKDILVLNSPYLDSDCPRGQQYTNASYLISKISSSSHRQRQLSGTGGTIQFAEQNLPVVHHGSVVKLNNDGKPDLAVGGDFNVTLFEARSRGRYRQVGQFSIPPDYGTKFNQGNCFRNQSRCNTPYTSFTSMDLDGDGQHEVIAALSNQRSDGLWLGQYFQALKKVNGKWLDYTTQFFPVQNQNQSVGEAWCNELLKVDINGDGATDLICSSMSSRSSVWTRSGNQLLQTHSRLSHGHIRLVKLGNTFRLVGIEQIGRPASGFVVRRLR